MSRFNSYMQAHFSNCRLIAEGFDQYREREVRVYLMPGHADDVGFTDGTDAWIVPLVADSCGPHASIVRGVSVRDLVTRIFAGETVPVARAARTRTRRELDDDTPAPRVRATPTPTQPPAQRRRYALA